MNIKLIALSFLVITLTIHAADDKKKADKKSLEQLAIASHIAAAQKQKDRVSFPYTDTNYIAHMGFYSGGELIQLTGIAIVIEAEIPKESDDSLGKILKTAHPNNFVKKFVNAYQDKRPVSEPCKFCSLIESPTLPIGHMMQCKLLSKGHPLTICPGCNGTKEIVNFVRFAPYSFGIIKKKNPDQVYACYQLTEIRHLTGIGKIPKPLSSSMLMIEEPKARDPEKEAKS